MSQILRFARVGFVILFLVSCVTIPYEKYIMPLRQFINRDLTYWEDHIVYRDKSGLDITYYKNGRPAVIYRYGEGRQLDRIEYLDREGIIFRQDSLVFRNNMLVSGYYIAMPEHRTILSFHNTFRKGRITTRLWKNGEGSLLTRELFLFNRSGNRLTRTGWDSDGKVVFAESFHPGNGEIQLRNDYKQGGKLALQTVYRANRPHTKYRLNKEGMIVEVKRLNGENMPLWISDLQYDSRGNISGVVFRTGNQKVFARLGSGKMKSQRVQTWRHPSQPGVLEDFIEFEYEEPFYQKSEVTNGSQALKVIDYRLPESSALFRRRVMDDAGRVLRDTLYNSLGPLQPVSVIYYDEAGLLASESGLGLSGQKEWLHDYYRDDKDRIIREELITPPDSLNAAVTRFYDIFDRPSFSEVFGYNGHYEGSWQYYSGAGIQNSFYYDEGGNLRKELIVRPSGDTLKQSEYIQIEYLWLEKQIASDGHVYRQRRFSKDGLLNWILDFDSTGQVLREEYRKKDGSVYRRIHYKPKSRVWINTLYGPQGDISAQEIHKLNSQGKEIRVVSRNSSGKTVWERRYVYQDGQLSKAAQLNAEGKIFLIYHYSYNDENQLARENAINAEGDIIHSVEYRYDEAGRLIWKDFNSPEHQLMSSNRYYYDEENRISRDEIIEFRRLIEAVEYRYYPEHQLRLATHYDADGIVLRQEVENYFGDGIFVEKVEDTVSTGPVEESPEE